MLPYNENFLIVEKIAWSFLKEIVMVRLETHLKQMNDSMYIAAKSLLTQSKKIRGENKNQKVVTHLQKSWIKEQII